MVKFSSGYWNIMDPTKGFTAIHRRVLERLNLERISKRFFFESDMLINLNILNAVVQDVAMPARYGKGKSTLSITMALFQFPPKLLKGLIKRIFLNTSSMILIWLLSIYYLDCLSFYLFGLSLGIIEWIRSIATGEPRSAGTIMLVALPIIVSFQKKTDDK